MAKPNYSFEKRQRELLKKKKKEEKAAKKASGEIEEMNPNDAMRSLIGEDAPPAEEPSGSPPPQP